MHTTRIRILCKFKTTLIYLPLILPKNHTLFSIKFDKDTVTSCKDCFSVTHTYNLLGGVQSICTQVYSYM